LDFQLDRRQALATHAGLPRGQFGSKQETRARRLDVKNLIVRFVREEEGQDLIEYAMLATLIALVAGVAAQALGTNLSTWYGSMGSKVGSWSGVAAS